MKLTPRDVVVDNYDVTTDSGGHRVVVWQTMASGSPGIGIRTELRPGDWGPVGYFAKGKRVWDPRITTTSRGRLLLVYRQITRDGRYGIIRSTTKGVRSARWSAPQTVPGSKYLKGQWIRGFTLLPDAHNRVALGYQVGRVCCSGDFSQHVRSQTWSNGSWGSMRR